MNAGTDDVDHVMRISVPADADAFFDNEPDPFIRYRKMTYAWRTAIANGMTDAEFIAIVRRLETPFRVTSLSRSGNVWIKDETSNVGGSHKARHMMGLAIWLAVAERLDPTIAKQRLAIASCGNAALAAAIVARAAGKTLDVFIPTDANERVVARLQQLGAHITRCERREGERGDPAYLRFREAVERGALPFTTQGNENGLSIEGCHTLAWEIVSQLGTNALDAFYIQVGGGALASACIAAFGVAHEAGVLKRMPRIHAVQTQVSPLKRAWDRVGDLDYAIHHRSKFMWPWESAPHSVAHGIIDDETYDWAAVVRGMRETGGWPIVVSEE
ncbi:MAG TPA: pyridoxal-phosphate dependent enzyme, partial [Thermoanaerobaculia bacterium]|nr:pyridoxal-phosphate dependent enzyme [Thermoanaerobaculia bacterium]